MFITAQYKVSEKFENPDDYTHMKIRFHVVLGKEQDEVWSLIKIKKVVAIKKDVLFENMIQNFRYHVIRANNQAIDFCVADFPLMNLNDLIQVALLLKEMEASQLKGTDKEVFRLGLAHIKIFIDNYYDCLALTDEELASSMDRKVSVAMELSKTQAEF